jgi:tetratricopeptide (TPR) repeat protein
MEAQVAGVVYELRGQWGDALACYRRVLKVRPRSFVVNYRASSVADRVKDYETASACMRVCADLRPDHAVVHHLYAGSLYMVGRYQESAEQYDRSQALDPDLADIYLSRLHVRLKLHQADGFRRDLARYDVLKGVLRRTLSGPSPLDLTNTAGGSDNDGPRPRSPIDPDEIRIHTDFAYELRRDDQYELALAEYDRVIEADPDHLFARMSRAAALTHSQRDRARAEYARLFEHPLLERLVAEYPLTIHVSHWAVAHHVDLGNAPEAVRVARRGLEMVGRLHAARPKEHATGLAEAHLLLALALAAADPSDREEIGKHLAAAGDARRRLPSAVKDNPALLGLAGSIDPALGPGR